MKMDKLCLCMRGMAGTGKRADHNKTRVLALYGTDYFGKQGNFFSHSNNCLTSLD